jgi:carboxyl-terminal processing protease
MKFRSLQRSLVERRSSIVFSSSLVGLVLIGLVSPFLVADDLLPPTRNERNVAKVVLGMMKGEHLLNRPLDRTISSRAFDQYIRSLDPLKIYLMQADLEEFEKWRFEIGSQLSEGDYTVAIEIFKRFLQRVDERTQTAIEAVDLEHDFTLDEEIITDPKRLEFAKDEADAREIWRKRIKYNLLVLRADKSEEQKKKEAAERKQAAQEAAEEGVEIHPPSITKTTDDPQETLRKRYRSLARRWHQLTTEDVVEMYITAVTSSFDPHTTYMSSGSFRNFLIQMGLQLEGIGATLQATDEGYTVIRSIVPGGAADKQGTLKVEDKIMAVGQGDEAGERLDPELARKHGLQFVDTIGMRLDDVVSMIRGRAGTVVRLQVLPENASEMSVITIVREKIKLEDSAALGQIFEFGTNPDGSPKKLGVIELPSFYADMEEGGPGGRSTTTDVKRILNNFKAQNVDAVVLDLRRNGGGSLREAIDCTGLFINYGTVVQVKDSLGRVTQHDDEVRGMAWDGPLVVLTSKLSASASEILAGAIQDYRRGIIVGDTTTHGKGTVQNLKSLDQQLFRNSDLRKNLLGALKITTQQFYRPSGESTQKRGVLSDIVLPSIYDKMDIAESDLDYAIEFDTVPSARITSYERVNEEMLENLNKKSMERVAQDSEFQSWVKKIDFYVQQKAKKAVSLNEVTYLSNRDLLNSDKVEENVAEEQSRPKREIKRDYYLDEILRIANDYVDQLKS